MISLIAPVFLIIFIGWYLAKSKLFPNQTSKNLMGYIYWVAAPAIIFSAISRYHLSDFLIWKFWIAYSTLFLITTILAYVFFKLLTQSTNKLALTLAYSSTVKNTVTIGMPLLLGILGNISIATVVITLLFYNCLAMPILIFFIESGAKKSIKSVLIFKTLKNPLVFASILGFIFSIFKINTPAFISNTLDHLGASFMPCALFAVGADFSSYKFKNNFDKLALATIISIIVTPLLAILISILFKLPASYSVALVILASTPTAQIMYAYVSQYADLEQDTAAVISATTTFSLITMPIFIGLSYLIWPAAFMSN